MQLRIAVLFAILLGAASGPVCSKPMRGLLLIADYGANRVELPLPEPAMDHDARRTVWDAGEVTLGVIGRPCRDTMSGEAFETEVVVYWQGRALRGCGHALH